MTFVSPIKSIITIPKEMFENDNYKFFRGVWMDNVNIQFSTQARLLCIFGIIKSVEDELTEIGKRTVGRPGEGENGPSTADIGQLTYDGRAGLSETIQILWPNEGRTASNLRDEIQWLVFKGFEVMKNEWLTKESVWEKLQQYSTFE